jgi:diguanylate cyclase (GGDEF)-like protein
MMDIDLFKAVNDTYGHLVGDRVLKAIAGAARGVLREGDILVRYGGEEFLAVLPAASSDDVAFIGERIRRAVEDMVVPEGQHMVRVTLSVGGAALSDPNVNKETDLIELADQALYQVKQSGRNRVQVVG